MRTILFMMIIVFLATSSSAQNKPYFQQDVAYKIEITLNPQTQKYFGTEKITYTNNSKDALSYLWFHLYPNAYKDESTHFARQQEHMRLRDFHFSNEDERGYINLESVTSIGQDLKWQYKEDAIDEVQIFLHKPLASGDSVTLNITFTAKFPIVFSRSGHWKKKYFQGTQWYPKVVVYDKYGWHPDSYLEVGEFYGEFGTFDVTITLPQNFVIDATGMLDKNADEQRFNDAIIEETKKLVSIKDDDEREDFYKSWKKEHRARTNFDSLKTVRFLAENVHDFAWFAGEDYMIHQKITQDSVLSKVLVLPENAYDWRFTPDYIEKTLWFYGDRVGKYKYPKAAVVDGTHESSGGMEYPMITLITINYGSFHNMLEMVISHEVGHNWFQGMLGSNERANVFLDEGLNTFYDAGNMAHLYGPTSFTHFDSLLGAFNTLEDVGEWHYYALQLGVQTSQGRMEPMNMRGEQYGRTNYSIVNYAKAVFMLNALRWTIGEENFDKAVKTYFERWHFKHPELDDFWVVMEEVSGQDLKHFRKEWMETTHYSDFKITCHKTKRNGAGFLSEVFVKDNGSMENLPAPVYMITENNDTLEGRWSGNEHEAIVFEHSSPLKSVEVNLKRLFFETDYLNNGSFPKVEFRFLDAIPGIDKYKVSFYPYLGYEYFKDGTRLGAGFIAGNWLQRHYLLSGSFYFGSESSQIGYNLAFSHRIPGALINYSNIYLSTEDKDGLKNISAAVQSYYSNPQNFTFLPRIKLGISHINLHDMHYHEAGIYERVKYTVGTINLNARYRKMLWNSEANLSFEKSLDFPESKTDYFKTEFRADGHFYLTKSIQATIDIYGGFVSGDDIPSQEYIFAGGNVDPKHENNVLGYRGSVAPLRSQAIEGGMNMPGYSHNKRVYLNNKAGVSSGAEIKFPYLPIIYGRVGALADNAGSLANQKFFSEAGLKMESGPLAITLPLWVSNPFSGEDNFEFRFYFSINSLLTIN